jgi:hypothetical protein
MDIIDDGNSGSCDTFGTQLCLPTVGPDLGDSCTTSSQCNSGICCGADVSSAGIRVLALHKSYSKPHEFVHLSWLSINIVCAATACSAMEYCSTAADCISSDCQGNTCQQIGDNGPCTAATSTECTGGYCCNHLCTSSTCSVSSGGPCWEHTDCYSGQCNDTTNGGTCYSGISEACPSIQCASGLYCCDGFCDSSKCSTGDLCPTGTPSDCAAYDLGTGTCEFDGVADYYCRGKLHL